MRRPKTSMTEGNRRVLLLLGLHAWAYHIQEIVLARGSSSDHGMLSVYQAFEGTWRGSRISRPASTGAAQYSATVPRMYSFAKAPNVRTSRGALLDDRLTAMSNLALCLPRQLSGIDELHGRVPAQRQTLLATVLVAIEDRPRPSILGSDTQRQPWR
jgi:hypothetical protein